VPGKHRRATSAKVAGFAFRPPNLIVERGAVVQWRFRDHGIRHDVTVASGPVGFGSPWRSTGRFRHRFSQPGRYLLQCSLHPAYMSQVVRVRR
jgi:plastocyanin